MCYFNGVIGVSVSNKFLIEKVRELLRSHGRPSREVYFDLENSGWVPRTPTTLRTHL